jgi:hypothetical protein
VGRAGDPAICGVRAARIINNSGKTEQNTKGDCFAKEDISAAETAAREDTRISSSHEDGRRPQGACRPPQEGAPSAHTRISRRAWSFPARRGWCGGESLTPFIARASAARIPTSLFFFAPTNCRKAGSASASKKRSAGRWCAIASGDGCGRLCGFTAKRSRRDGIW